MILEELYRYLVVFITAALPVVELRGAIPLARTLGLEPPLSFILAVGGNILPVAPLLLLLEPVRNYLEKEITFLQRFFAWLDNRTHKRSRNVEKYGMIGLVLLTAIPLPTTGAWTASLVAIMFKISFWPSFSAICAGVVIAGVVVTTITFWW